MLVNTAYLEESITYETNVTDISNVLGFIEDFSFSLKFNEIETYCDFKKYENYPLFLICQA